jgi:hypothetical protein
MVIKSEQDCRVGRGGDINKYVVGVILVTTAVPRPRIADEGVSLQLWRVG